MKKKTYYGTSFDEHLAESLRSPKFAAAYLAEALKDREPGYRDRLVEALQMIAKAYGISRLTEELGLSPKALYWSLKKGKAPSLETFLGMLDVFGIRLEPKAKEARAKRRAA